MTNKTKLDRVAVDMNGVKMGAIYLIFRNPEGRSEKKFCGTIASAERFLNYLKSEFEAAGGSVSSPDEH